MNTLSTRPDMLLSGATVLAAGLVVAVGISGCSGQDELLPGHSRPVLEHDWSHPRDLRFADVAFQPPDPQTTLFTAPNGLRAFVMPDAQDPIVLVTAAVPAGRRRERAANGEAGASETLFRTLAERLQQQLGTDIVARVQTAQEPELLRLSVETLAADGPHALAALLHALSTPLDAAAVAVSGGAAGGGGGGGRGGRGGGGGGGSGAGRAAAELERLVATAGSAAPAGVATPTTGASRAGAALAFARRAVQPSAVVLAVAGGIERAEVEGALRRAGAGWGGPAGTVVVSGTAAANGAASAVVPPPGGPAAADLVKPPEPLRTFPSSGATSYLAFGHVMPAIDPADEAALAVLGEILNIRLNIAIRERRGLSNRALLELPRSEPGLVYVRAGSRPEAIAPVIHFSLDELKRIRDPAGRVSDDELEQVKGGLADGMWQGTLDGARTAAATYALETVRAGSLDALLGWPARVRAVTADDVAAVAQKYIHPDRMGAVVVGEIDAIRAARHPRWSVTLDEVAAELR